MAIVHGKIKIQMMRETMSVFTGSPLAALRAPFDTVSLEFQQKGESQAGLPPDSPSEKSCREADPALKGLESREQYWRQNDPSGMASLTGDSLCPSGGFGCVANTGLRNGAESNPNFKLGSRKCASRETFCLVSARLCQPFTIPVIDRLPFDTPSVALV